MSTLPPPPPPPEPTPSGGGAPPGAPARRSGRAVAATVILAVQAGLVIVAGLLLWVLSASNRHRFANRYFHVTLAHHPVVWGFVLLAVGVWLVVLALGVARGRGWAPLGVYITETVVGLLSLLRWHPVRSVIGVALAAAVVILVATDDHRADTAT